MLRCGGDFSLFFGIYVGIRLFLFLSFFVSWEVNLFYCSLFLRGSVFVFI